MDEFNNILGSYDRGEEGVEQSYQTLRREIAYLQKRLSSLEKKKQRKRDTFLIVTVSICAALGMGLWALSASTLPASFLDWMASTLVGGNPWEFEETLMKHSNNPTFEKMIRLYKACGPRSAEECETAMRPKPPTLE